jgi:cytochrome c553
VPTTPTDPSPPAPKGDRFGFKAAGIVVAVAAGAWLTSFIAVPVIEGRANGLSAFDAICRAIGIGLPATQDSLTGPAPSQVAWTPATFDSLAKGNTVAGAKIAQDVCQACHVANGQATQPLTPSMSGQSARAIYKQLQDFKSGARISATMNPIAADLTLQQMADAAAYYGGLARRNDDIRVGPSENAAVTAVATLGDAARALPACQSCHAAHAGGPFETPMLMGQYPDYFAAQLHAYADGSRHNDLYGRMRAIAGKLTEAEIIGLAAYYNAPP